jgi:hypothetical protein
MGILHECCLEWLVAILSGVKPGSNRLTNARFFNDAPNKKAPAGAFP